MFKATTTYTSNKSGASVIVAKGGGKQRTVKYDHAVSPDRNHAQAMFALITETQEPETVAAIKAREKDWTNDGGSPVQRWEV